MKQIIAPVDFSDSSINALDFAAEIATRAGAGLLLMHVMESREEETEAQKKLKALVAELKKNFGAELKCDVQLAHGNLVAVVKQAIASGSPDLIVMGTKGASGVKKIFIGSNTVNVIAKTKFPVLVIPESARFKNFLKKGKNKVVLATNLELLKNEHVLDILKEIALLVVEPKVRVLSVRPKNTKLAAIRKMERDRLLQFFSPEIEAERITVFSSDVISGIEFYLDENENAGLVAMVARDSGVLLRKHYTREMASHTHLPLLVLHDH